MKAERKSEPRRLKFDSKALLGGLLLAAAIPLLMLWQSSISSKGTSPGFSKYNEYQHVSVLTMYLAYAKPDNENRKVLHPFCIFALWKYRNGSYAAAWIDYVASQCGECADVHLARAWLFSFMRNASGMQEEIAAARRSARDEADLKRIDDIIAEVMVK